MRAYLAPGVPPELMHAALRRAWVADPAIRGFVGLAEYAWDFTDPAAMPGFGELQPGYDVRKLIAEVFGEAGRTIDQGVPADRPAAAATITEPSRAAPLSQTSAAVPAANISAAPREEPDQAVIATEKAAAEAMMQTEFVHHSKNIAPQNETRARRKHGGALPE